jgi:beta-glucosidase
VESRRRSRHPFHSSFVWGVSTSAYQIEGGLLAADRCDSIWDTFCRRPGAITDGSDGDDACDSYARWQDDVDLLKAIGVNAYRFSLAWPRVFPEPGRVNEAALDHYEKLIDALLEAGIEPWVTLYHWDLPQHLEDAGGWPERETAESFAEYVDAVTRRLGDRVKRWITINEPWCAAFLGYHEGIHAPGRKNSRVPRRYSRPGPQEPSRRARRRSHHAARPWSCRPDYSDELETRDCRSVPQSGNGERHDRR